MVKITIEVEGGGTPPATTSNAAAPAQAAPTTATTGTAASAVSPPPDMLAEAAVTGVINAGPGPSSTDVARASAPIASSVGGTQAVPYATASAGPAPPHVFQT